jgi:hypothetical protein
MDLLKMIAELETERARLDEAILALERLSAGKARRRGRPPRWLKDEIERQGTEEVSASEGTPGSRRAKVRGEKSGEEKATSS